MINVTKSYLPDFGEYTELLKGVWERVHLTNSGPLLLELETRLKEYLGVKHLLFCSNGTVVLQMAIKALGLTKEIITTPFSYCATTHTILWERCTPVFADVRREDYTIDPAQIERVVTENTEAIMATHVYGNACQMEAIQKIADQYKLKVIYDGAHVFGSELDGRSLLSYGDVSTCSFHATKVFHTVEGGIIICHDDQLANQLSLYRSFGHRNDDYFDIGINAKNSEFHAAMGLCVLPKVPELIAQRRTCAERYDSRLDFSRLTKPSQVEGLTFNYAYYPVALESEAKLLQVRAALNAEEIFPRRYFYPSLNTLPFVQTPERPESQSCPVSEDVSLRVLCLPLYPGLDIDDIDRISATINRHL